MQKNELKRLAFVNWIREAIAGLRGDVGAGARLKRQFQERVGSGECLSWSVSGEPVELIGEPTSMPPVSYHIDCLTHLDWGRTAADAVPSKVLYHLQMLGWAVSHRDESLAPLVSIVIPVFNGRDCIGRAIASCLSQTYRRIEIIVVDDGSTDGTAAYVASLDGPIRLVRQENGGAAAARNRGLAESCGDFVQYLDADDELLADSILTKLSAFAQTPDARLCYSHFEVFGDAEVQASFEQTPLSDDRSAVWDPMLACTSRFPFQLSTVLAPRWYLDQVGPMEEELRQSEDVRYYVAMARQGLKAIAVARPTARRHRRGGSLTGQVLEARRCAIEADLRTASEMASEPRQYRYIVCLMTRSTWLLDRAYDEGMDEEELERFHVRMMEMEEGFGSVSAAFGGVRALLADQLMVMLREKSRHTSDVCKPTLRLWHERELPLRELAASSNEVGGSDLRRWLPEIAPQPYMQLSKRWQVSLKFALEQLQLSLTMGEVPIRLRALERLSSDYPGHPYERYWRSASRLARVLGEERARTMCRQRAFRDGWQLLGRARRAIQSVGA